MIACIYHGGCPDGFAAAWVVSRFNLGQGTTPGSAAEVQLIPASYGMDLPTFEERPQAIYVVDFSWPKEQMAKLAQMSDYVMLLDHHQTTLDDIFGPEGIGTKRMGGMRGASPGEFGFVLDMNRSGAAIAWDHFSTGTQVGELLHLALPPLLLRYVQDRDLWRWEMALSREIGSLILSLPHELEVWDAYMAKGFDELLEAASGARMFEEKLIEEVVSRAHWCSMRVGTDVRWFPIVNSPYIAGSTVAERLMDAFECDMAAYYLIEKNTGYRYGFRSRNGVEVNRWAEGLGGGGHVQASGCFSPTPIHLLRAGRGPDLPRSAS